MHSLVVLVFLVFIVNTFFVLLQGENKCKNANCSHLCLPNPQNYTCACPTGFRRVGATQCAEEIESFLVFTRKTDIRWIIRQNCKRAIIYSLSNIHIVWFFTSDLQYKVIQKNNNNDKNNIIHTSFIESFENQINLSEFVGFERQSVNNDSLNSQSLNLFYVKICRFCFKFFFFLGGRVVISD